MPIWKKQVGNYTEHTTSKLNKKEWQYLINYPKHLDITGFVYWKPLNSGLPLNIHFKIP